MYTYANFLTQPFQLTYFENCATDKVRGYDMYKDFQSEIDFHQHALKEDLTRKIIPNVSFHGELVLRHVIPHLVNNSDLYAPDDWNQFTQATLLVNRYISLQDKYKNVATDKVRGYDMYKDFQSEKDFHQECIHLPSAALF